MVIKRKPHFFKVLLGDFANQLKLPPNFLKHVSNDASKRAILVSPNGRRNSVELKTSSDGTFLSNGWSKFVEDHSLKEREFLVFRYNGNMHFNVQVFDTTACEREDLFDILPNKKPNIRGNHVTSLVPIKDGKHKSKAKKPPANLIALNSIGEEVYFSKRCPFTTKESLQACEAAKSFSSDFPSVIVHMTRSNVYKCMMRFPICFSRKHLPRERTNMSMRDPKENAWIVVYIPGKKDQRDRLSRGWTEFVLANSIDEGDFCVFELKAPTEMKVHIFRAC